MRRDQLFSNLAALCGPEVFREVDRRKGWPGLAEIKTRAGWRSFEVHVGPIGLSHRLRDGVERRFQNPGKGRPVLSPTGAPILLLGIWSDSKTTVISGMEAQQRLGKETRQSLFMPLLTLQLGADNGWETHSSSVGEEIHCFWPELLPVYAEMKLEGVSISSDQVRTILSAAGVRRELQEAPAERARRAATILVRSSSFSRRVLEAYGELCAMCDLNLGLVEGAHIYPARAPGATDEISNGLALCSNHHRAFDKHLVHVKPGTFEVSLNPDLVQRKISSKTSKLFVETTRRAIRLPQDVALAPSEEMFRKRYDFFDKQYSWAK